MDIISQIVTLFFLILGMVFGEIIVSRAFGRPTKLYLIFIELIAFVVLLVVLSNYIFVAEFDVMLLAGINFTLGLIAVVVSRAVVTGIGKFSALPQSSLFQKYTKEERALISAIEAMSESGIPAEQIREKLAEQNIPKADVERILSTHKFETKPNPLATRVAELEDELAEERKK